MGLAPHADAGYRLPVLTTVRIPDGIDDMDVRRELLGRHSMEIGGGLGDLKGKVWRVGLMGESSNPGNVFLFLSALGRALNARGFSADVRAATTAATARIGGSR